MNLWNVLVAVAVAFAAAGGAFTLASEQNSELESQVKLLEDNLTQTRSELGHAKEQLAKADTAALQSDLSELSQALWTKIEDLNQKVVTLETENKKLAAQPVLNQPGPPAANPETGSNPKRVFKEVTKESKSVLGMFGNRSLDQKVKKYSEKLNLTESQAMDLKRVLSEHKKRLRDNIGKMLNPEEGKSPGDIFGKLMTERDETLKEVLTPEQYDKFKELEEKDSSFGIPGMVIERFNSGGQPEQEK